MNGCIETIGWASVAMIALKIMFMLYNVVYAYFAAEKIDDLVKYTGAKWAGWLCSLGSAFNLGVGTNMRTVY